MNTDFLSKEADSNVLASELIATCGLPVNEPYLINNMLLFFEIINTFYTWFFLNLNIQSFKTI